MTERGLQDALALDRSILFSMLQRNRCAHGRTRYFQRMEMVMKALNRSKVETLSARLSTAKQLRLRTHKRKQYEWTLDSLSQEDPELIHLKELVHQLTVSLPDILSRIEAAAHVLFYELGRGFFLPFNTIAIGAIARIRIILMKIGRQGLMDLNALLVDEKFKIDMDLDTAMRAFVESDTTKVESHKHDLVLNTPGNNFLTSNVIEEVNTSLHDEDVNDETSPFITDTTSTAAVVTMTAVDFGESLDSHYTESSVPLAKGSKDYSNDSVEKNQTIVEDFKRKRRDKEPTTTSKSKRNTKKKRPKDIFDEIFG